MLRCLVFGVVMKLILGLVWDGFYAMFMADFVVSIRAGLSSVERVVFEMSLGQKTACTGAPKVPRARNCVGSTLMHRFHADA